MKVARLWMLVLQTAISFASVSLLLPGPRVHAQLLSSGISVPSDNWCVLVNPTGYVDLVIDKRAGFDGREYLSGEWAPAIGYAGHSPMWLAKQHLFPDWETNSDLETILRDGQSVWVKDQANPFNADGNLILQSMQRNAHVEITHDYQIWNVPGGLAQGLSPQGGQVPNLAMNLSDDAAYQHTLTFRNISAEPLIDFNYYHLIHSLQAGYSVYDDTDHGGTMGDYHYDFTQRGVSHSLNTEDHGLYKHTDYVTAHSKVEPDAVSVGYYGIRGIDMHDIGKPGAGVHLDIESDTFTGITEFEPDEGGWVAGAARYALGTIGVGESVEFDMLLSLVTMSELVFADACLRLENPIIDGNQLKLFIRDKNDLVNTVRLGFTVEASTTMAMDSWMPLGLPFRLSPDDPGRYRFEIPYDPAEPRKFYRVALIFGS